MTTIYKVSGMTCGGCARSVERAIKSVAPDATVTVDLASGRVSVDGEADEQAIAQAIDEAGFDFGGVIAA
jgi:copper chaperone